MNLRLFDFKKDTVGIIFQNCTEVRKSQRNILKKFLKIPNVEHS